MAAGGGIPPARCLAGKAIGSGGDRLHSACRPRPIHRVAVILRLSISLSKRLANEQKRSYLRIRRRHVERRVRGPGWHVKERDSRVDRPVGSDQKRPGFGHGAAHPDGHAPDDGRQSGYTGVRRG